MLVAQELIIFIVAIILLFNNIHNGSATYITSINLYQLMEQNIQFKDHIGAETINSNNSNYESQIFRNRRLTEENTDDEYWQDEVFFANSSGHVNITALEQEYIDKYTVPKAWTWLLIFFHCLVFLLGLSGNILVCVAVYRNQSMRTVTNYFIVNLAIADALVILFCLPFSVVWDVTSTWWFGTVMCKIVLYIQSVSVTVSILTLAFISMDRWYAICFPLKFKSTTGKAVTAICIIWIIALTCEIPEAIVLRARPFSKKYTYFTQCSPTWDPKVDMMFMIIKMVLFYWFPLFFMSIAYTQIIRVLWQSGKASHHIGNSRTESCRRDQAVNFTINTNKSTEGQLKSRRNVAKMLVAVVAMFALCFLPVHALSIVRLAIQLDNTDLNRAMFIVSHWLCYANSAANPIIYNFMSGKFRQEFKSAIFQCSHVNRTNFRRTSTYIYRLSTTNTRNSTKSGTEMVPLRSINKNNPL